LSPPASKGPADEGLNQLNADQLRDLVLTLFEEMGLELAVIEELKNTVRDLSIRSPNDFGSIEAQPSFVDALKGIVQQLAPLQELAPRRTLMKPGEIVRLQQLRDSLQRPEWTGAGSLSVQESNVAFIGEVVSRAQSRVQSTQPKRYQVATSEP
jgi:hypothetical protein